MFTWVAAVAAAAAAAAAGACRSVRWRWNCCRAECPERWDSADEDRAPECT